jgi:hypothetical protein
MLSARTSAHQALRRRRSAILPVFSWKRPVQKLYRGVVFIASRHAPGNEVRRLHELVRLVDVDARRAKRIDAHLLLRPDRKVASSPQANA